MAGAATVAVPSISANHFDLVVNISEDIQVVVCRTTSLCLMIVTIVWRPCDDGAKKPAGKPAGLLREIMGAYFSEAMSITKRYFTSLLSMRS